MTNLNILVFRIASNGGVTMKEQETTIITPNLIPAWFQIGSPDNPASIDNINIVDSIDMSTKHIMALCDVMIAAEPEALPDNGLSDVADVIHSIAKEQKALVNEWYKQNRDDWHFQKEIERGIEAYDLKKKEEAAKDIDETQAKHNELRDKGEIEPIPFLEEETKEDKPHEVIKMIKKLVVDANILSTGITLLNDNINGVENGKYDLDDIVELTGSKTEEKADDVFRSLWELSDLLNIRDEVESTSWK